MGRKKIEYNKKQGDHLKAWLNLIDMTEQELADVLGEGYHQQTVSRMKTSRPIRPDEAVFISENTKYIDPETATEKHVRPEYLLGISNFMFDSPYNSSIEQQSKAIQEKHVLATSLIESHGYKIGTYIQGGNFDENGIEYSSKFVSLIAPNGKTVNLPLIKYHDLIQAIIDDAMKELLFTFNQI